MGFLKFWFQWIFRRLGHNLKPTVSILPDHRHDTTDSPEPKIQQVQIFGSTFTDVGGDSNVYNAPVTQYQAQNMVIETPRMNWPQRTLVSPGAMYNSEERSPPPRCHPGTREAILKDIQAWYNTTKILWLHGPAGAGKSAIAQTIAEIWAELGLLAASFFFSRLSQNRNALRYLFPTIAIQLALATKQRRHKLGEILAEDPLIIERKSGAVDLIVRLFEGELETAHVPAPQVIVIDGLDECQDNKDQSSILKSVVEICNRCRFPLRFFIVSRPEPHLKHTFGQDDLRCITKVLSLYGDEGAHDDVAKYLRSEFFRIYDSEQHRDTLMFEDKPWPSDDAIKQLVEKSGGYFIYAATVIRYIDDEYCRPAERLKRVLRVSNQHHHSPPFAKRLKRVLCSSLSNQDHDSSPFGELDKLYLQVLSVCPTPRVPVLKKILGFVLFFDILSSVYHIEGCLRLPPGEVLLTLKGLHSLVRLEPDTKTTLHITSHHASFLDFLLDPCRSEGYHLNRQEWFEDMFHTAISLQSNGVGVQVFKDNLNCRIRPGDDDRFMKFAPFRFAQMCIRLCPNLIPYMETMRRVLEFEPSNEDRLSSRDFWSTIEGLLQVSRVFKHRQELSFCQDLTKRCNWMLRSRLSRIADSPENVQYVQAMITLHSGFPRAASSSECREWPELLSFTKLDFGVFPEVVDTLGLQHCLECAETLDFLENFQLDSTCCGIFYDDTEVRHAFVTTCLIRSLSDLATNYNSDVIALLFQLIEYHIELAKAGDVQLMAQLRTIEVLPKQVCKEMESPGFRTAVISWLKKSDPPYDMLAHWES